MIIKNANIDNEPILSNVGQVGEFRIRNSAKAFNILSSGLYANKIRAIIREYSCNAVDSHVEAGKMDTPFDVHLPGALEPWFSVRDYGVGLDEKQVRDIFTTYFESTKSGTDELIGGLGLGSKSAFSYTDNFTIVAVKNGVKRVFTAFINEQGVPSIAPMGEEASTDPTGVEIRFAVQDHYDFRKFYDEARHVYKHFKLRPVVNGGYGKFEFIDPEYIDRDIVPGVHSNARTSHYSYAVMGNIEYPLSVPANADLGNLGHLLSCGLTIEFGIGELDIQASREGLSYIPDTIAAIKGKLEALNSVLADKIASEMDAIKNPWEKAFALGRKMQSSLWASAAQKYVADTKFDLIDMSRYANFKAFLLNSEKLAKKFNIKISSFQVSNSYNGVIATTVKCRQVFNNDIKLYEEGWQINVSSSTLFVENDTAVGAATRAKYHWKNSSDFVKQSLQVFVLEKADKKKDMKLSAFYKSISNPPASQRYKASSLMQKERAAGIGKDVSILKLERRDYNGHMRSDDMVWRDAGALSGFDDTTAYYYLPLSGFQCQGAAKDYDMKTFAKALKDSDIVTETVYGVRKADLETIQGKSNWVNLDDHIRNKLAQQGALDLKGIIKESIGFDSFYRFSDVTKKITNPDSPYLKLFNEFSGVKAVSKDARRGFEILCSIYNVTAGNVVVLDEVNKYSIAMNNLAMRYPLLGELTRHYYKVDSVAEYINAIDLLKGI